MSTLERSVSPSTVRRKLAKYVAVGDLIMVGGHWREVQAAAPVRASRDYAITYRTPAGNSRAIVVFEQALVRTALHAS